MVFHFDTIIRQLMVFRNDERMEETLHNSGYYKSDGDIGEHGGRTLVRELSNCFDRHSQYYDDHPDGGVDDIDDCEKVENTDDLVGDSGE